MAATRNQNRKEEILGTLANMLETSLGQPITTARLASAVGVSEAALYRHFPSKAKMFDDLINLIEENVGIAFPLPRSLVCCRPSERSRRP